MDFFNCHNMCGSESEVNQDKLEIISKILLKFEKKGFFEYDEFIFFRKKCVDYAFYNKSSKGEIYGIDFKVEYSIPNSKDKDNVPFCKYVDLRKREKCKMFCYF